ncbi:MAG: putative ABC transport system ATP-binding protein, partial [Planctomycetota bacterium]
MLFVARSLARRPLWWDLNVELGAGEVLVVRGPSGGGKSLLLRALADLDPLQEGQLLLHDKPSESYTPADWRRRVLYLQQGAPALSGTVAEDMQLIADMHGLQSRSVPGLADDAATERLSGGELQRLALERAFLCEPDVLLLDEATSALDEEAALACEARVGEYVDAGHGALWVSHDAGLAERLNAR